MIRCMILMMLSISIHAPVKGATPQPCHERPQQVISIHAPVKGATGTDTGSNTGLLHFNPRSREGSDKGALRVGKDMYISIHAPVKGATD